MIESTLIHGWTRLLGSLAFLGLIGMAFAVMLRIIKPADVPKHIGAFLLVVILLATLPGILIHSLSALTIWQQLGLLAIGIGIWQWRRPRRKERDRRKG